MKMRKECKRRSDKVLAILLKAPGSQKTNAVLREEHTDSTAQTSPIGFAVRPLKAMPMLSLLPRICINTTALRLLTLCLFLGDESIVLPSLLRRPFVLSIRLWWDSFSTVFEEVPEPQNCKRNRHQWIYEKSTRNWFKCCKQKLGYVSTGDYMCQHVEPLYMLPPVLRASDSILKKALKAIVTMINAKTQPKTEGISGPERPPVEDDPQGEKKGQLCFQTASPGRFLKEGCYCWRGIEECVDASKQQMFFL
eukprot:CAMPEP_0179002112 /NCGR_PEP_ID=MMETSP0795-20121207/11786_1 /TAXON_ID=88552 /ORGANISM="Amoebophrya sp., Strain Ameob2" /LENGTH=250 /DNA_ID=CAMNT_0020695663 /DNA_START=97 /DNA_END=850 /DNA_ORIENTATION=+